MALRRDEAKADQGLIDRVPARELWDKGMPTWVDRLRWWVLGQQNEPAPSFTRPLEKPDPTRVGVCCSGGGIRSASFNLGALQEIQKEGRLQKVTYLAAVSGGSYIAAAFAMVCKTWDPGPPDPEGDDSDARLVTKERPPFYPGSPEEQYLRNRASYLAPAGIGKVMLVWRIMLGLLVNLLLVASAITLLAALLALYYRRQHAGLIEETPGPFAASPSATFLAVVLAIAALGLLLGFFSLLFGKLSDSWRRGLEALSVRLVFVAAVGFVVEALFPELIARLQQSGERGAAQPALSGRPGAVLGGGIGATVASILAAVLLQLRARVREPKEAIAAARGAAKRLRGLAPRVRSIVVYLAATVLGPFLLAALLVVTTLFQVDPPHDYWLWLVPLGVGVIFFGLYFGGDLTSWSLHPFYRRRLCTAFALKRVRVENDENDVVGRAVERKQGQLVPLSQTGVVVRQPWWESTEWPTLVICAAANISDPGATPPGRGVTSFTFSPHAVGGPLIGGIKTHDFIEKLHRRHDLTLPAAVAMSGAALSPSMGKLTRPSLRFLMGLANVRLGVWVPNPRRLDVFIRKRTTLLRHVAQGSRGKCKALIAPPSRMMTEAQRDEVRELANGKRFLRPRPRYLLKELFGWNSVNDPYLYVSDGGHYENLGLVELLRRGCMKIYCFDASGFEASGGKAMTTLGDAIALARSELGVEIEFGVGDLDALRESDEDGLARKPCALGTIRYTRGELPDGLSDEEAAATVGTLIYAPTVMTGALPWDVHAFKATDPVFPHHSTVDQLYTDQKFEAYRILGRHAARSAIAAMDAATENTRRPGSPGSA